MLSWEWSRDVDDGPGRARPDLVGPVNGLAGRGLDGGSSVEKAGAAVQSGVYRTTLAAVLVCPVASAILTAAGFDGLTFGCRSRRPTRPSRRTSRPLPRWIVDQRDGDELADTLTAAVEHPEPPPRLANETRSEPALPANARLRDPLRLRSRRTYRSPRSGCRSGCWARR